MATRALTRSTKQRLEKQARLAAMLAQGMTLRACATALDVSKSQIGVWANDPEVLLARQRIEQDSRSRAQSILADRAPEAAQRLADLAGHENPIVATKAAGDVLKFAAKATEENSTKLNYALEALNRILEAVQSVFVGDDEKMAEFFDRLLQLQKTGNVVLNNAEIYELDDEVVEGKATKR
jgi:transposase